MAITEISVSKIYVLATEPTNKIKDRFWFDTTNNLLKRYDGTSWKPISVSSDDVVVLSNGNKISLTSYLNTQIATLAEGIDTKQDKLSFYTEVSGASPSATISVKNIKLEGSVAEGSTLASGNYSHAEGFGSTASGNYSHAEGSTTTASGNHSHAEGFRTTASSYQSHSEGIYTKASSPYQHAQGKYNIEDANEKYADIIGNGTSEDKRSNAATVSWDGISWSQTDVRAGGTDQDNATYSLTALAEGIDTKQDKLKFYTEVDKSADTSSTAKGSEINLKTSASQYGGSEINLIATNGQYQPGNINLKAKSYDAASGGNIILESEGGSGSGGKITLYSKVNTDGSAEPGGNINIIADSGTGTESNIKLQADNITLTADNAIVLNSGLSGSGISTYIKGTTPDNESPTITVVDTKVPSEKAVYNALETKQKKLSTYSETIPTDKSYPEEVIITAKGQNLQASNGAGKITLSATDSSDSGDEFVAGTINLNASKVQKNGKDIAITDDLTKKQDKLKTYSEIWPSGGIGSAEITAEQGFSIDSKQVKIGGGIFGAETIIDGNIKGDSASSKIRVAGQAILIQEINSNNEGSSIELTQSGLIINSDEGITGNILEKTISNSSSDTKIPTAKAVYTAVNAKANKSTTLSGYGITNAYTKTEVDTKLKDYETKEDFNGYTSMVLSTYQQKTDITLETTNKTIVGSINEINENTSKKQDKLSYYSENATTNKANISIDGKSTGKSEFSINVTDSTGDTSGDSTINLSAGGSAGSVSNGAGKINLEVSGSSGGKISLSAINGAVSSNTGIELNVPFDTNKESYIGENSGIIFNGPISGTGITKTITDVDYKLPTSGAVKTALDKKQNKLYCYKEEYSRPIGAGMQVSLGDMPDNAGIIISNIENQNKLVLNGGVEGTAISTSIPVLASSVDTKIPSEKAVRTELNKKQDTLTAGTNISISNNKISVSGLTKSSVGLGNVDNTSDKNKPISTATQTALDAKQNQLVFYNEDTSSDEAYIQGADSFSVQNTNKGLIVDGNNGGITVKNNSFNEGQGIISIAGNAWKNGNQAILFDYDGQGVAVSDALLIPEIKNKQDSSDSSLTTNDKTIVGAINELNNQVNTTIPEPITSVYTIGSTALSSIISNTTYAGVSGQILISADVSNTGPILIGENISDKANAFPIYPDQIFPIPFSDINNFKVTGTVNDKFNYIISFRSLSNTSPVANGGITILNENGYYKLTPEGDGDTATLVITKLK